MSGRRTDGPDGPILGCAKVGFVRASELSGICSGRTVITIQNREKQSERPATCFRAKGTQCDSPGQRPGKMRNECSKPKRGEMTVHPHYVLSGLPRSKLSFPGAMPQAFTLCRVAARPFGNAIRGDGTKTGPTSDPNQRNSCAARSHPAMQKPSNTLPKILHGVAQRADHSSSSAIIRNRTVGPLGL